MNSPGYRLLGYLAWQAGKWYLRQRLPSRRKILLLTAAGGAGLILAVALARRASG